MDYGFSTNCWLQVISEIQSAPEPEILERPVYIEQDEKLRNTMATPDMIDQTIGFGALTFSGGHAYTSSTKDQTNGVQAIVAKELRRDDANCA